ncbi:oxidoreductase [Promicromonospora citrea]|uniref:Oxidoreductase n=1 Tax=Promicromonospora citrea TaxID=43677 RepID=A0A8H9GJK0_9MICO|nr:oxidoreductase [Promicromonospora citrea]NNH53440.1 oxidoreductase [Promicromonospora citrea]GGM28420.1 oxidoreductase [Promicromonospora citrea]
MTTNTILDSTSSPAAAAGTWRLGDVTVNRVGYGSMRVAGMPWEPARPREASLAVLRRAVELGVNHLDTAAFYFTPLRSSNELISTALQPYGDDLVIATKVGPARSRDGRFEAMARPEQLRAQVEENLRQLGRDHLDVVNLRWGTGHDRDDGSVAEHVGALGELRDAGLVRNIGLSNVVAAQLTEALTVAPIVCVQNRYGLTERASEDVLELCGRHGIAFVPFFAVVGVEPGPQAAASAGVSAGQVEVEAVASAHGATAAQVRLAWTLHRGAHVLAIPGTGSVAHLEENVAAGALRLSGDELALLDGVAAPVG